LYAFKTILKVMHPFTPFITEEIWQALPFASKSIMTEVYPTRQAKFKHSAEAEAFENIKDIIRAIRNKRAEMDVAPSRQVTIYIKSESSDYLAKNIAYIQKLANVQEVHFTHCSPAQKCAQIVLPIGEVYIPLGELIDTQKEKERLEKEYKKVQAEIARSEGMLNNTGFLAKAPAQLVALEKEKLAKNKQLLAKIEESRLEYIK